MADTVSPLEPYTPEEVHDLARGIVMGQVYWPPDGDALENSFGAMIALCGESLAPIMDKIGWVVEDLHKAGPMAVNGYPMFLSMRLVHVDSVEPVLDAVHAMLAAMENVQ